MLSFKQKFGKRVRELRKCKKMTQEELAELISMEPSNISKLESGMHFPGPEKIEKIAKILAVEAKELFDFEHFNKRADLIEYINNSLEEFELKDIELIYKFIYNLKLYK